MAMEPSLQLALLVMPTMVIVGWMTGQNTSLEFDTCKLEISQNASLIAASVLRTTMNSGIDGVLPIRDYTCSVYREWQI